MPNTVPENQSGRITVPAATTMREPLLAMEPRTFTGFLLAVVAVVIIAVLSYHSLQQTAASSADLTRGVEALGSSQRCSRP